MTPKEKGKELLERYLTPDLVSPLYGVLGYEDAKQCALIAVDEILDDKEDALDVLVDDEDINLTRISMEYWQQVKTEINQL